MNAQQYKTYYEDAYNQMREAMLGRSYKEIGLLGNSAATLAANLMQKEENELAYKRSSAANQVNLMRSAGMSRAGAINALNGGGSYTPAAINVASTGTDAQNVRAQDMNMLFSALEAFQSNTAQLAQLQEQKRQFNMQHAEQKRQFDITHAETKRMNDDALLTSSEQRRLLGIEINGKTLENNLNAILVDIEKELAEDGTTINAERAERVARAAAAILNDFRDKRVFNVLNDMTDEELQSLFEIQGIMNTLTRITNYDAPQVINDVYQYAKKALKKFF